MNISGSSSSKTREPDSAGQKGKTEQDSMKSFIETLKKVENAFKNQVLKESSEYKKTFYLRPKQNNDMTQQTEYFIRQEKKAVKENTFEIEVKFIF